MVKNGQVNGIISSINLKLTGPKNCPAVQACKALRDSACEDEESSAVLRNMHLVHLATGSMQLRRSQAHFPARYMGVHGAMGCCQFLPIYEVGHWQLPNGNCHYIVLIYY